MTRGVAGAGARASGRDLFTITQRVAVVGAALRGDAHAATMAAESITNGYGRPTTAVFEDPRLPAPISFAVSPDVLIYDGPSGDDAYFDQTAFRLIQTRRLAGSGRPGRPSRLG